MTDIVYSEIQSISDSKAKRGIEPTHATLMELKLSLEGSCTITEIKKSLRTLLDAKRITAGKTLNDTFIKIAE